MFGRRRRTQYQHGVGVFIQHSQPHGQHGRQFVAARKGDEQNAARGHGQSATQLGETQAMMAHVVIAVIVIILIVRTTGMTTKLVVTGATILSIATVGMAALVLTILLALSETAIVSAHSAVRTAETLLPPRRRRHPAFFEREAMQSAQRAHDIRKGANVRVRRKHVRVRHANETF